MAQGEGFRAFFRGLAPPLAGLAALNAISFGCYGGVCRYMKESPGEPLSLMKIALAGVAHGDRAVASPPKTPTFTHARISITQHTHAHTARNLTH